MRPGNIIEANRHAESKRREAGSKVTDSGQQFGIVDPILFKYFFDLQVKLEKEFAIGKGNKDYHTYARRMWEGLIGEIDPQNEEFFRQFESALVFNLHGINMEPLVYQHVAENLTELIKHYEKSIKDIVLWSTGDVEATGYQIGKIESSKIIKSFHKALKIVLPKGQAGEVMKEKTSYLVADNKFKALTEYIAEVLEKRPDEKIRLVIIEDSRGNFDKAKKVLLETFGEEISQVEIIPIWTTYSREGKQAEEKAQSSEEKLKLQEQKRDLNAIGSFEELLDSNRFGSILNGAHVLVDFDGVIGNNISMREEQARATYSALVGAVISSTGQTEQEIVNKIKAKIQVSNK